MIGLSNSGSIVASIIGLPLGGFLATLTQADGGWPLIFYSFGGLGIIWFVFLLVLTSNSPSNHRFKVCIGMIIAHVCFNWGNTLFLTQLPSYLKDVLKFDIKSNGLISALPYIGSWILIVLSSVMADYFITSNWLSRTVTRKLFTGLGFVIPALAMIGLAFVTCSSPFVGVGLLIVGVAFTGFCWGGGFAVNFNEVCGEFSGVFFGVSNTFACIPGIVAPYLVGVLTPNQKQEEWRVVFWITAGVFFVGFAIYSIFAKAELQRWAVRPPQGDIKVEKFSIDEE